MENRRLSDGRITQRQVLYLGEINASQREAWRKTVEVFDEGRRRQVTLFPVGSLPGDDVDAIGVRLSELRLERPRLPPSREGTPWEKVLKTLVVYRLADPGSEWRLQWYDSSAMANCSARASTSCSTT